MTSTSLGYRMPAEWEPHAATWLAWPHNRETWPGKFEPIPAVWQSLVRVLCEHEPVNILAGGAEVMAQAESMVGDLPNVTLHDIPTNDVWIRDHGPTFLVACRRDRPPALVDWQYNSWGGKYPPYDLDNAVPRRIAELLGRRRFAVDMVMEGGAIDVNGGNLLLTTEQCLLNPNRNPAMSREQIETQLKNHLGAGDVVWLGQGLVGDDTDGHIDELARFVAPLTVVAAVESDSGDENYEPLQENLRRLRRHKTHMKGEPLDAIELPMPRPIHHNGQRLPASYLNFYIANGLVIVPQYGDPADAEVLDTLGGLFPKRRIVGLSAVDLSWGLGAFHCITQQEPADWRKDEGGRMKAE